MATFNAMDVWQTVCYLTVFFSVLEFCFVIYLTQKASWEDGLGVGKKKVDIVQNQKESHKVKIFVTWLFYSFVHGMSFDYFEVLMLNICLFFIFFFNNQKQILFGPKIFDQWFFFPVLSSIPYSTFQICYKLIS